MIYIDKYNNQQQQKEDFQIHFADDASCFSYN